MNDPSGASRVAGLRSTASAGSAGTSGGAGVRDARGQERRQAWRASLVRAPLEALVEELRERDALRGCGDVVATAPVARGEKQRPLVTKKRTTAEQWALVAASDADLVAGIKATQRAIYGEDGRVESGRASPEVRRLGASVAALFARRDVLEIGGQYHVMTRPFGEVFCLAPGEAFAEQACGAYGTAWVLDEHHMVTAGHCVPAAGVDEVVCVFGFALGADGETPTCFGPEQVAFPSAALSSRELAEAGDGDWAVLRFEQPLPAPPLKVRTEGEVVVGEAVWMLGHPCGIPLKYAPGAIVTGHKNDDRFFATLDAFAGNSGSPVFDARHQVVGVLVRGAEDWAPRADGLAAQVYLATGASAGVLGEEVMKLDRFLARRPVVAAQPPVPMTALGSDMMAALLPPAASRAASKRRATTERPVMAPLNAHALLVQIARYPEQPLPETDDAEALAAVLGDAGLGHYPPEHVRVLRDAAATRAGMLTALRELAAVADADSTVTIFFSGCLGQRGEATYFLPYDGQAQALTKTAISTRQMGEALAGLRAARVLLVLDCCPDSGRSEEAPPVLPGLSTVAAAELLRGRDWAVIASGRPGQRSRVRRGARHSVFCAHLLDGLRGGRPSDDGYVRVLELFEHLQPRVTAEGQEPCFHGAPGESFAVARHRGGAVAAVPRTSDGFLHHALLLYAPADAGFVREVLLPPMLAAGLRVAGTHDRVEPGMMRVVGVERGLAVARRVLVVVSQGDGASVSPVSELTALSRREADLRNGRISVLPIYRDDPDVLRDRPSWLVALAEVWVGDAAGPHVDGREELARLVRMLDQALPAG